MLKLRALSLRMSEAVDMDLEYRVSKLFTSSDVSLPNIVMFLGCNCFETCQILLLVE